MLATWSGEMKTLMDSDRRNWLFLENMQVTNPDFPALSSFTQSNVPMQAGDILRIWRKSSEWDGNPHHQFRIVMFGYFPRWRSPTLYSWSTL